MKPILAALVAVALGLSVTSINANNTRELSRVFQSSDGTTVLQKQQKEQVDKKTKSEAAGDSWREGQNAAGSNPKKQIRLQGQDCHGQAYQKNEYCGGSW